MINDSLLNSVRKIIRDGLECKMRQFHPWGYISFHQKLDKPCFRLKNMKPRIFRYIKLKSVASSISTKLSLTVELNAKNTNYQIQFTVHVS